MMKKIDITFDSNVWENIVDTEKLAVHSNAEALTVIRQAVEAGLIACYISDTYVTLETPNSHQRASHFKEITNRVDRTEPIVEARENVARVIFSELRIRQSFNQHPGLDEIKSTALVKALALGFRFINVPRIGWLRLEDDLYKPMEIDEQELAARLAKTNKAVLAFEQKGLGSAHVWEKAKQAIQQNPDLKLYGQFLAFAHGDSKKIPKAVAEWADGDALAAHYGHGHDVFCTLDNGRNAGTKSVLHKDHRQWLKEEFGLNICTPTELAAHISQPA